MSTRQWKTAERRPSKSHFLKTWVLAHSVIVAGLLVITLLFLYLAKDIFRSTIIIEVTAVPQVMKDAGLDSEVLTKHLLGRIEDIENTNYDLGTTSNRKSFRGGDDADLPAYDIPGLQVSTRDLIKLLRHAFGKEPTSVDISVSQTSDQTFRVRGRIRTPQGQMQIVMPDATVAKFEDVTELAAFGVLGQFDPVQLANMLYLNGDARHVDVLQSCIDRLEREKKILCLVGWGDIEIDGLHDTRARRRYQQALAGQPETLDALVGLGYIEQLRGNVTLARSFLERARRAGMPKSIEHYYRAQARLFSGETSAAVWELQQAARHNPHNAGLLIELAQAQRLNKDEEASTNTVRLALDADLSRAATMSGWGKMLIESGQVEEGMEKLATAKRLTSNPRYGVHTDISEAMANVGDADAAVEAMRAALKISPTSSYLRVALAVQLAAGEGAGLTEAEQHLRQAIEYDADDWRAYGALGYVLALGGQQAQAERHWQRARTLNPTGYETYQYWGDALAHAEKFEQAAAKFRQALALAPHVGVLHESLAGALSLQGTVHQAEAELEMEKGVQLGARTPARLMVWATMLERHGKYAQAEKTLRAALAVAPHLPAVSLALGNFLVTHGRHTEAVRIYEQALLANLANADLRFGLIDALIHQRDYSSARRLLEEAEEAGADAARIRLARTQLGRQGN